jgi:hypothetical protein
MPRITVRLKDRPQCMAIDVPRTAT